MRVQRTFECLSPDSSNTFRRGYLFVFSKTHRNHHVGWQYIGNLLRRQSCGSRVCRSRGPASITVFLGLTTFWDFVHYTSEHPPVFYLSLAWAAAFASGFGKDFSKRIRLILACIAAVFLSLVPFAKLQGTLLALVSGIAVLALPLLWNRKDIQKSIKEIMLIGSSALAFPLLFSLFLAINGAFEYFWNCYIQSSLLYKGAGAGGITRWELIAMVLFADGAMRPVDLLLFLSGSLLFFLICLPVLLFPSKKKLPVSGWIFLGVSGILLAATIWTVTSTMRNYPHYFYFLPFAVTLVLAGIMSLLISKAARERNLPNDRFPAYELAISLIFLMLTAYPLLEFFASRPHPRVGSAKTWSKNPPITPISQKIIELAEGQKGRLTIWGYNPVYYRETGMLSATRLSTSSALFDFNKLQPFFLSRYLEDLEKHRPIIFVDAVAPDQFVIMNDREKHGFEKIAPIKEFVEKNYDFVEEIDGVRFFRLKGASPKAN